MKQKHRSFEQKRHDFFQQNEIQAQKIFIQFQKIILQRGKKKAEDILFFRLVIPKSLTCRVWTNSLPVDPEECELIRVSLLRWSMSIPSINTEEKKPDLEADQLTERRGEERKRGEGERCDELEQALGTKERYSCHRFTRVNCHVTCMNWFICELSSSRGRYFCGWT